MLACKILVLILFSYASLTEQSPDNNRALLDACGDRAEKLDVVKQLLAAGASAKAASEQGETPLHLVSTETRP